MHGAGLAEALGESVAAQFIAGALVDLSRELNAEGIDQPPYLLDRGSGKDEREVVETDHAGTRSNAQKAFRLAEFVQRFVHAHTLTAPSDIPFMLVKGAISGGYRPRRSACGELDVGRLQRTHPRRLWGASMPTPIAS
ncbi:MAG: hypothetical protein Q8M65_11125 [Rhodoglobus sp.]|nr:hypothetical protein [Rhodoglobus sp.]